MYADDLSPLPLGKARFTAVNAIAGGPDVDLILSDGRPVIPGVSAGTPTGTLDVPVFTYDFVVVPAGGAAADALVTPDSLPLDTGTSYVLLVYGTADSPASLVLSAPTDAEVESGMVRVVHGIAGASPVDVYFNDTLAIPSLDFGQSTEAVAVPAGDYTITVRGAGSDADLFTANLTVEAGQAVTVAALGTSDAANAQVIVDDVTGVSAPEARLALVNGIPGNVTLSATLVDGTSLGDGIAFGETGEAVDIPASSQAINLSVTTDSGENNVQIPEQGFYGGVYYNLVAVENNGTVQLLVGPTSLAQGIASAPNAGEMTIAAEPPTVEAPILPTPAPAIAAQPTEVPPAAPQPTAAPPGPTGRVFNLNPDANLQLRQYPNTGALSLGTVPPGTVLVVNGREGGIEPIPFSATPNAPEGYEFVDPATLLADPTKDDLVPRSNVVVRDL